MGLFADLLGTSANYFKLGLQGVRLKNSSGALAVRNTDDSADANLTAGKVSMSGADLEVNTASQTLTLSANSSQAAGLQVILPAGKGTDGQVLRQKAGSGTGVIELEWASAGDTSASDKVDTTSLAYNSSSEVAMFSTGADDIITKVQVVVDTAFDATGANMSVGVSGTASKYMASNQIDLSAVGVYEVNPGLDAQGAEDLIITFAAGSGGSAGAARVLVFFGTPT